MTEQALIELMNLEGTFGTIANKQRFAIIKDVIYKQKEYIDEYNSLLRLFYVALDERRKGRFTQTEAFIMRDAENILKIEEANNV